MTAAPLPAPLPDRPKPCPLCGVGLDIDVGSLSCPAYWHHPDNDCLLRNHGFSPQSLASWNRRAPEAQAWRAPSETPDVPSGEKLTAIVAVRWGDSGRVFVVEAHYLSAYPIILDDDHPEMTDEGFVRCTGWYEAASHPDYDEFFQSIARDREVIAWQPLPAPPGATPAAPPARETALVEALRECRDHLILEHDSEIETCRQNDTRPIPEYLDKLNDLIDRAGAALAEAEGRAGDE